MVILKGEMLEDGRMAVSVDTKLCDQANVTLPAGTRVIAQMQVDGSLLIVNVEGIFKPPVSTSA